MSFAFTSRGFDLRRFGTALVVALTAMGCEKPGTLFNCLCYEDQRVDTYCEDPDKVTEAYCVDKCGETYGGRVYGAEQNSCRPGFAYWLGQKLDGKIIKTPKIDYPSPGFASQALQTRSPDAPYRGNLVEAGAELSRMRFKKGTAAFGAWVPARGSVSLSGELCQEQSCPLSVEYLRAEAKQSFSVGGDSVSRFLFTNYGPWLGVKNADNTYYFHQSSAANIAGTVNGDKVAAVAEAVVQNAETNVIRGSMVWPTNSLPQMRINGTFSDGTYTVELDLAFDLSDAAPEIKVGYPTAKCPGAMYEATMFSWDYTEADLKVRWLDQNNKVLGTGRCLKVTDCAAGRGPVIAEVTDPMKRKSSTQMYGDPVLGVPRANEGFGQALAAGDFNGDGFNDVVVGAPRDMLDGHAGFEQGLCGTVCPPDWLCDEPSMTSAGAVVAMYGSPDGVTGRDGQFLSQYSPDTAGGAEAGDLLGSALAVGDFNNDAFMDVAVGTPGENISGGANDGANEGAINIFYGSINGLKGVPKSTDGLNHNGFNQNMANVPDDDEMNDFFGWSLAAADFDRDGAADLAIGAPGEDSFAGSVTILYGKNGQGLSDTRSAVIRSGTIGLPSQQSQMFGYALHARDINRDGYGDLAIGIPGRDTSAGAVAVLYGSANGLLTSGAFKSSGTGNLSGYFGYAVHLSDVTNDGYGDLLVGAPGAANRAGRVARFAGSASGITTGLVTFAMGETSSFGTIPAPATTGAYFGASIATGLWDGDEKLDIIIGAPYYGNNSSIYNAGLGVMLRTTAAPALMIDSNPPNASFQDGDRYATSIIMADLDRNGRDDIVVGVPGENVRAEGAGLVRAYMAPDHRGQGGRVVTFSQDSESPAPPAHELPPLVIY